MAESATYDARVVALVMGQRPATIRRNWTKGVLCGGKDCFGARDVQLYMLRKGMGSVQLHIVERLLELAASSPGRSPAPSAVTQAPPRGRPPMPPGVARDQVVRVRLTAGERERIGSAAVRAGLTLSEYVRGLALGQSHVD